MTLHPLLPQYLRIAYACMACDGDIAASEVSCLRSIAVQMGQPVEEVDAVLDAIAEEFGRQGPAFADGARSELRSRRLEHDDAATLLDIVVQLVEADGTTRPAEVEYVRKLVDDLALDREALRTAHPEWREFLGVASYADLREVGPRLSWPQMDIVPGPRELKKKQGRQNDPR